MKDLVIFGAGGHAESLLDIVQYHSDWKVSYIIGKNIDLGKKLGGLRVEFSEENINNEFLKKIKYALIGIGQIGLDQRRYNLLKKIEKYDLFFPKIISPLAYLSKDSYIGDGTVLFHHSLVNTNVKIGNHCIINSKALIEHGCKIGNFCHISTGAIINGEVKIGNGSFIGSGVIIREGLTLPDNTIISAGKRVMG